MGIAAIGLALSAFGTIAQVVGQSKMASAQKKAESARQQQLQLDTSRRNRETVRQGIQARSAALFAAASQGAEGGSGLQGGQAQVTGQQNRDLLANNQNEGLGNTIFSANRDYYSASSIQGFGVGLSSIGGTLMSNAGLFNRVGGTA